MAPKIPKSKKQTGDDDEMDEFLKQFDEQDRKLGKSLKSMRKTKKLVEEYVQIAHPKLTKFKNGDSGYMANYEKTTFSTKFPKDDLIIETKIKKILPNGLELNRYSSSLFASKHPEYFKVIKSEMGRHLLNGKGQKKQGRYVVQDWAANNNANNYNDWGSGKKKKDEEDEEIEEKEDDKEEEDEVETDGEKEQADD